MQNKSDFFGPVFILGLAELQLGVHTHPLHTLTLLPDVAKNTFSK